MLGLRAWTLRLQGGGTPRDVEGYPDLEKSDQAR